MIIDRRTITFFVTLLLTAFFASTSGQANANVIECFNELHCPFVIEDQGSDNEGNDEGVSAEDGEERQAYPAQTDDVEMDEQEIEPPRR